MAHKRAALSLSAFRAQSTTIYGFSRQKRHRIQGFFCNKNFISIATHELLEASPLCVERAPQYRALQYRKALHSMSLLTTIQGFPRQKNHRICFPSVKHHNIEIEDEIEDIALECKRLYLKLNALIEAERHSTAYFRAQNTTICGFSRQKRHRIQGFFCNKNFISIATHELLEASPLSFIRALYCGQKRHRIQGFFCNKNFISIGSNELLDASSRKEV